MNPQTIFILAIALFVSCLAVLRTYPRRRWVTTLVLLGPVVFFSIRWARYRSGWIELGIAAVIAALGLLIWWIAVGRKGQPPQESSIRVWSEDDPF